MQYFTFSSTIIYDIVLLSVCHFHHHPYHHQSFLQLWPLPLSIYWCLNLRSRIQEFSGLNYELSSLLINYLPILLLHDQCTIGLSHKRDLCLYLKLMIAPCAQIHISLSWVWIYHCKRLENQKRLLRCLWFWTESLLVLAHISSRQNYTPKRDRTYTIQFLDQYT